LLLIPLLLSWGSFLNVVGYRLIHNIPFFLPRSFCPSCKSAIYWYDNIPLFSWFWLRGKCRYCRHAISWLYPFIEFITTVSILALVTLVPSAYWLAYFVFFSALIVSIRTDLERFLISRYVTLALIPFGLAFSYFGLLPISLDASLFGSISAYLFLCSIGKIYHILTKRVGLGQGDVELLAFIGSFIGIMGWWLTLLLGSCIGTLIGLFIAASKQKSLSRIKIPFGPFLAFGALAFVLFQPYLLSLFLR
jgi:leader peptidase (prepilin peptidase) / N-methyltransferase